MTDNNDIHNKQKILELLFIGCQ